MFALPTFRLLFSTLTTRLVGLLRFDFRSVSVFMARLSSREQRFVSVAGVGVAGLLLYLFVVDPLWEMHDRLHTRVAAKERELNEVVALSRTYRALRQEVDKVRPVTGTTTSPVAFLENLASNTVGRDKVAAINPAGHETRAGADQEMLELSLTGVSLRELVELLYKIDTASTPLRTAHLSVKKTLQGPVYLRCHPYHCGNQRSIACAPGGRRDPRTRSLPRADGLSTSVRSCLCGRLEPAGCFIP